MSEPKTAEVKVVPCEPTEAMIEAMDQAIFTDGYVVDAYRAMLAASPPAETGEGADLDLYDDKVQEAISWTMRQWGEALGLKTWTQGDGSETVEGDVGAEIINILTDAGLYDREDGTFAKLAQPVSPSEGEAVALTGRVHDLKTWREPFAAVRALWKPWELRLDDRGYQVGDTLNLREWDEGSEAEDQYTGEIERRVVTWLLRGPAFGLPEDYVIMSMRPLYTHPASDQSDTERMRAAVMLADDAPVWADGIITDGSRVAFAQKSEADHGGTYWAIDKGSGAIEWEPTHFIARAALSLSLSATGEA